MSTEDDDFELDLDLDDALDAWEKDFEDAAQAKAAPLRQTVPPAPEPSAPKPKPRPAGRGPLYQPDPGLEARKKPVPQIPQPKAPKITPPSPAKVREAFPSFGDDDSDEATAIAAVPEDLIASLQELRTTGDEGDAPRASKVPDDYRDAVELDLDGLFGEDEDDDESTRIAPAPVAPPAVAPPAVAPPPVAAPVAPPPVIARPPAPPPLAKPGLPRPKPPRLPQPALPAPSLPQAELPRPQAKGAFSLPTPSQLGPSASGEDDLLDPFAEPDEELDLLFGDLDKDAEDAVAEADAAPRVGTSSKPPRQDEPTMEVSLAEGESLEPISTEIPVPPMLRVDPPALDDEPEIAVGQPEDDGPEIEFGEPDDGPELEFGEPDDDGPELEFGEPDDDGPELEFGEPDDDGPELEFGESDDGPALEFGDEGDDAPALEVAEEDDDGPELEFDADAAEAAVDPAAAARDQGAATAQRTVRHRKPREEKLEFVGTDPETLLKRGEMLKRLAASGPTTGKARCLVAAAEIFERLARHDEAHALFVEANEADPRDLLALRALRRAAMHRGDWDEVVARLQAEAALPLSALDKSLVLTLLAEIQLSRMDDAEGAERSCRAAMAAHPSVPAGLLWNEAARAQGRGLPGAVSLQKAAEVWKDDVAASTLLTRVARDAERAGQTARARTAYTEAAARHAGFAANLGRARVAEDPVDRAEALSAASAQMQTPSLQEGLRRLAARWLLAAKKPAEATALLDGATRPAGLKLKALAALRAGDADARTAALTALAEATGGANRALALLDLAEARAQNEDIEGAQTALKDAALADETLDTIRVVREILTRKHGALLSAPSEEHKGEGTAVEAAAKLATSDPSNERAYLLAAAERGEAPLTTALLLLDLAAKAGDDAEVVTHLRAATERAAPEQRLGVLLALAARLAGDDRRAALQLAADEGGAPARRALVRMLEANEPAAAGALWQQAASDSTGDAAFFEWCEAGRAKWRGEDPDAAIEAWKFALDEVPGAHPASWALERAYLERGDAEGQRVLLEQQIDAASGPKQSALLAVQLAFAKGGDGAALQQAHDHLEGGGSHDPVLESMLSVASGTDPLALATLYELRAQDSSDPGARRIAVWRAGAAYESAGDHAAAANLYRTLFAEHPDPITSAALERAELASNQHARVGERRFVAVKEASDPAQKLAALEDLAALDLYERGDMSSAVLTLQSILEDAPGHLPTLRVLERHFMTDNRDDELARICGRLMEHLDRRGVAIAARLRARLALLRADAPATVGDATLREAFDRLTGDAWPAGETWVARRLLAVTEDPQTRATAWAAVIDGVAASDEEQAAFVLRAAEAVRAASDAGEAAAMLGPAVAALPRHPLLAEAQADALLADGEHAQAADAFELAAAASQLDTHRVACFYAAGRAWEEAGDVEHAMSAYEKASEIDVTYADIFERARILLERGGHHGRLADLTQRRLDAGGDASTLVELHETHAALALAAGDRNGAREAFRRALALEPNRIGTLRKLAELSLEEQDYRAAAETLIRIARLRQDREELRWVFFTLGDLYDRHMPDPRRAEAAFSRVLKLLPEDLETMDRLAELYIRENNLEKAVPMLQRLYDIEIDPDERRRHRLRIARAHEASGDARTAERVLDETRRVDPTDLVVLRAMADLYERQNAPSALAMHLGRALSDFRRGVRDAPSDVMAWTGLVDVLDWKGRPDAARAAASASVAYGVQDVGLSARVGALGEIPGAGAGAFDADLRDMLAPAPLGRAIFEVFRLSQEALDKAAPFDAKAWRAQKYRTEPLRSEAQRVGAFFGATDVQLLVTSAAPRLCLPVGSSPVTLLIGDDLASGTDERQRAFLFARAISIAQSHLTVAMRTGPELLAPLLAALHRVYDPHIQIGAHDPKLVDDLTKKLTKGISRRSRDALGLVLLEMVNAPGYDPTRLGVAAAELGDRLALLALGSVPAGVEALLQLAGLGNESADRVVLLDKVPEARELVHFAISDAHFDARQRAGADRN